MRRWIFSHSSLHTQDPFISKACVKQALASCWALGVTSNNTNNVFYIMNKYGRNGRFFFLTAATMSPKSLQLRLAEFAWDFCINWCPWKTLVKNKHSSNQCQTEHVHLLHSHCSDNILSWNVLECCSVPMKCNMNKHDFFPLQNSKTISSTDKNLQTPCFLCSFLSPGLLLRK